MYAKIMHHVLDCLAKSGLIVAGMCIRDNGLLSVETIMTLVLSAMLETTKKHFYPEG